MSLYVAVCPPDKKDPRFGVWLANGVTAGKHLAACVTVEDADRTCVLLAMYYKCRALPLGPSTVTNGEARPR